MLKTGRERAWKKSQVRYFTKLLLEGLSPLRYKSLIKVTIFSPKVNLRYSGTTGPFCFAQNNKTLWSLGGTTGVSLLQKVWISAKETVTLPQLVLRLDGQLHKICLSKTPQNLQDGNFLELCNTLTTPWLREKVSSSSKYKSCNENQAVKGTH